MTDVNSTASDNINNTVGDDDYYDDAAETFPGKEDLKDRLVAVWALETGQDKNADGKFYPWVKTITMVLDNGPDGTSGDTAIRDGEPGENRVGPVEVGSPVEIDLRWSTEGMVTRLAPRVGKSFKPMVGRINSRKNKVAGRSPSWSISTPTTEDDATKEASKPAIMAVIRRLEEEAKKASDREAFGV